jgi:SAM-dependent methyltransferase
MTAFGPQNSQVSGRPKDVWALGAAYEPYIGRWSRRVAREFVQWLGVPPGRRWIDVGCGTGALTETILAVASPAFVEGVDPSMLYVEHARAHIDDDHVRFVVGDAQRLPQATDSVDAAVSGLVLNFVPDPASAVGEMARVVRPGGTVAAYVWDYADGMELIRRFWDAAIALDPEAIEVDEGRRFPICRPGMLGAIFREVGLAGVEARAINVPTVFKDFDDFWAPFLGGQGPAPGYAMGLSEDQRSRLRENLRSALPIDSDGSIALTARAWAVRGTKRTGG